MKRFNTRKVWNAFRLSLTLAISPKEVLTFRPQIMPHRLQKDTHCSSLIVEQYTGSCDDDDDTDSDGDDNGKDESGGGGNSCDNDDMIKVVVVVVVVMVMAFRTKNILGVTPNEERTQSD